MSEISKIRRAIPSSAGKPMRDAQWIPFLYHGLLVLGRVRGDGCGVTYEHSRQKAGPDPAALFVVSGWVDARQRLDRMWENLSEGWSLERRVYSDGRRQYATPPPDETELVKLLNEAVGLVMHAGHGTNHQWEKCFSTRSLSRVDNADQLPVMISAGYSTAVRSASGPYEPYCHIAGQPHAGTNKGEVFTALPAPPAPYQTERYNTTGLGEQLLRGQRAGAVAYIGCNAGSQPCGLSLLEGFTRALADNPHSRLGDCWSSAIRYYYDHERLAELKPTKSWYPARIFFQAMQFMVFGDPSPPLRAAR